MYGGKAIELTITKMKTVTIIIDFDNFFGTDINRLTSEKIELALSGLINICEERYKDVTNIHIRLYGGWYKELDITRQASALQRLLVDVQLFPKIKGRNKISGSVEMVSEIIGIPGYTWGFTHKEFEGVKPIRINPSCDDSICVHNKDKCPKYILKNFTSTKDKQCVVPSCLNIHRDVFHGNEQKMVDTIIACDILSVIEEHNFRGLMVVSDDQDIFPSIALANEKRKFYPNRRPDEIFLGIQNDRIFEFISDFFNSFKIEAIPLYDK